MASLGTVAIRRTYQDNKFFLLATLFIKENQLEKLLKKINFAVNGKLLKRLDSSKLFESRLGLDVIEKSHFNKMYMHTKKSDNYKVFAFKFTPEDLGVSFQDFETFSITLENKINTKDVNHFQIVKKNVIKDEYLINKQMGDDLSIKIPNKWHFYFGSHFENPVMDTYYDALTFKTKPIDFLEPINNIATTIFDYESNAKAQLCDSHFSHILYNKDAIDFGSNVSNFSKYYSFHHTYAPFKMRMPSYNIFLNNIYYQYKNNLNSSIISPMFDKNDVFKEWIDYAVDLPFEYDFDSKTVVLSKKLKNNGLIIPYNFSGDFTNTFVISYDYYGTGKEKDKIKIIVNDNKSNIQPLLDFDSGKIRLKITHADENFDEELKYSIHLNKSEEFLSSNITSINGLINWRNNEI
ncbi:MHO_1580 family protein [Mycoplasmopsis iners]|uniref:MHO_1580 family protein n=1 Tax=Mycoplasmopsis iners TaxID=76630 RepID=UPI000497D349|nr:hypothetical protein [Mycoplasmopsis iners]